MSPLIAKPDLPPGPSFRLSQEVRRRPLLFVLAALAAVSLVFVLAPGLDLTVSRLFYDPVSVSFIGAGGIVEFVRDVGRYIVWLFAIAIGLSILTKVAVPKSPLLVSPRAILFLLASLAIGPGLIVNAILKNQWGRARPREILEFGGDATFSPAWWPSDQCNLNCSFVSGEAAWAFFLVSLVFIVPKGWRPAAAIATIAFAALISATRIAGGGHFLSDVVIAWLVVLLVIVAFYRLILTGLPPAFDDAVEAAAGRVGEALRRLFRSKSGAPLTK